ncbi:MAG: hypothetical protein U0401_00875 [Anaerolineae bacterium]
MMPQPPLHTPYRRPWWLVVNKSAKLLATVREEVTPGERVFVIRGEPSIQGLGWLIWGPVGTLAVILGLVGAAVAWEINQQGWSVKALFIVAFLALPALVWAATAALVNRWSARHIQAERQAEAQECLIRLNQQRRELSYCTTTQPGEITLPYEQIRQAKVAHPIGGGDGQTVQLVLETLQGPVLVLNEALGTLNQKMDLAQEIQQALNNYQEL